MDDALLTNPGLLALARETANCIDYRPVQGAVCRLFLHENLPSSYEDRGDALYMEVLSCTDAYETLFERMLLDGPAALIDTMAQKGLLEQDLNVSKQVLDRVNHLNRLLTGREPMEMTNEAPLTDQLRVHLGAALSECRLGAKLAASMKPRKEHFPALLESQDMHLRTDHTSVTVCLHMALVSVLGLGVADGVPVSWVIPCTCMAYSCMQAMRLAESEGAEDEAEMRIDRAGAVCALMLAYEDDVPGYERLPLIQRLFDAAVAAMEQIDNMLHDDEEQLNLQRNKRFTERLIRHLQEDRCLYPMSYSDALHMNSDETQCSKGGMDHE
ncbi:MAG: hypothetical protein IJ354_05950 [Clostridia bacterium]|nr:hypothetical protein [Clostridia bacterium]